LLWWIERKTVSDAGGETGSARLISAENRRRIG